MFEEMWTYAVPSLVSRNVIAVHDAGLLAHHTIVLLPAALISSITGALQLLVRCILSQYRSSSNKQRRSAERRTT